MSFFPFAIVLQVTPIVAIFPLINIYVDNQTAKLLLCAWIVAFFPILSNTTLGLNSVDRNLLDLFKLNGATRWQQLWHLRLPAAMPYFLGGLKIAGGLSLIGAVVAEFVAGSGGPVVGPRLAHHRGRLPAQRAAAVRGADPDLADRHPDLPGAVADLASDPAALARERAEAGAVRVLRLALHAGSFSRWREGSCRDVGPGGDRRQMTAIAHPADRPLPARQCPRASLADAGPRRRLRRRRLRARRHRGRRRQDHRHRRARRASRCRRAPSTSAAASCCPASSTATPISTRAISGRANPIPTAPSWARSNADRRRPRGALERRRRRAPHGFLAALRLRARHQGAPHPSRLASPPQEADLLAGLRGDARTLAGPHRAAGGLPVRHRGRRATRLVRGAGEAGRRGRTACSAPSPT